MATCTRSRSRITSYNVCYTKLLRFEAGLVDAEAVFLDDVGGQVGREAVGVVEFEEGPSGNDRVPLPAQLSYNFV